MWMLLWLWGCGTTTGKGEQDGFPSDPNSGAVKDPSLVLTSPGAASFVAAGPRVISGSLSGLDSVDVNGQPAEIDAGSFEVTLPLLEGMTTVIASGTSGALTLQDSWSLVAGDFAAPSGSVADAVQVAIDAESVGSLGSLVDDLLDPTALSGSLTALNPVLDSPTAQINLTGLDFGEVEIALSPGAGVIDLSISIPDFVLGLEATVYDVLPFGADLTLDPDIVASEVLLSTTLDLEPDGEGGIDASVGPMQVEIIDFDLDTGVLELVDWLFLDDDDLRVFLEQELASLGTIIEPAIDEQLAAFDLAVETELLGASLSLTPSIDRIDIDPSGVAMSVGVSIEVEGEELDLPGHLSLPPPPGPAPEQVAVTLSDALMNRALYELWAAGAVDLSLPLDADDAAILFLFGGQGQGNLSMSSALPPVFIERDGVARLQLGEMALTVDTPGGSYGERVELIVALDAKVDISIGAQSAGLVLSDADVHMRLAGDSVGDAALQEALPSMQAAFGLGIGVINEQLSFPVADLLGGVVLPEIVLSRDPSGLGATTQLPLSALLSLAGLAPEEEPPPPLSEVPIPPSAIVSDGDAEYEIDNAEGWICGGDEVEVRGDSGVWFVEEDAELRLIGTGHTVYATSGAYVRLDDPGNVIYADPGAEIDDRDGTNTVTTVDPLSFDTSVAPTPGC